MKDEQFNKLKSNSDKNTMLLYLYMGILALAIISFIDMAKMDLKTSAKTQTEQIIKAIQNERK